MINSNKILNTQEISRSVLLWYDQNKREFPWRSDNGSIKNPYFIWISEVMLQQTTVSTVIPRFNSFIKRWPNILKLSNASLDEVLNEWQGLGYYSRAHNIHKTSKIIINDYEGKFPRALSDLKNLPGIGEYTAGAIASIAFSKPVLPIDVNVQRVLARLNGIVITKKNSKSKIKKIANSFCEINRPGDVTQAFMDIGSILCKPNVPHCDPCPINKNCFAFQNKITDKVPGKEIKKKKSCKYAVVFFALNKNMQIFSRKRTDKNLFKGMMELPSTPFLEEDWSDRSAFNYKPFKSNWVDTNLKVKHSLSHFDISLRVFFARSNNQNKGRWVDLDKIDKETFPVLFKKVINTVLEKYLHV